ncbi:MAG: DUF881 domain-containing protein [Dehalococcoidia bacterium]|nr:DUF881 domain-containing protein [Dehalococcoidia bacterium]
MNWRNLGLLPLAALGLVAGILGATQTHNQAYIAQAVQSESPVNEAQTISNLLETNNALALETQDLEDQLSKYSQAVDRSGLGTLVSDLNRYRVINGLVKVWGPGIEVVVGASIKPEEALDIINELRNAGAEGLALSGQRLVASSVVIQSQDRAGLLVDGVALIPPYVFQAIGDAQTMDVAVERKGGMVPLLRNAYRESIISVLRVNLTVLPAYQGRYVYRFARAADQQDMVLVSK